MHYCGDNNNNNNNNITKGKQMRKKTTKKQKQLEVLMTPQTPEEIRERVIRSIARRGIRNKKNSGPLRSVRGINKARGVHHGGPGNGRLCLSCLRRSHSTPEGECAICGNLSCVYLGSKVRLPRRTATKQHWKRFFRKHVVTYMRAGDTVDPDGFLSNIISFNSEFPKDFMTNVRRNTNG